MLYGHLHLRRMWSVLDATEGLRYRWMCIYHMTDSAARMFEHQVRFRWKPILVYYRPGGRLDWIDDTFVTQGQDKRYHPWGQSVTGTAALVEAFSRRGELVCDPFVGGGTTAVVCRRLYRRFIGCDIDERAVLSARARVAELEREAT